jgi:hypothetical protein
MARIRRHYGVPAKRGMVISYGETPFPVKCLIVGSASSDRLRARCERPEGGWSKRTILLHPTWAIQYPENEKSAATGSERTDHE